MLRRASRRNASLRAAWRAAPLRLFIGWYLCAQTYFCCCARTRRGGSW